MALAEADIITPRYDPDARIQFFDWDTDNFNFIAHYGKHLARAVGCEDPTLLHRFIPAEHMPIGPVEGTAHTYGHDLLYAIDPAFRQAEHVAARDIGFLATYRRFVRFIQDEIIGEPIVYQRLPSLRIQYPGMTSYGVMHTDREYNHPSEEINIWVPITEVRGTASMVIESDFGKGDYAPVEMPYGKMVIFDSGLVHGNVVNEEGYTRMSFDLRVIPKRSYRDSKGAFSATAGKEFTLGNYYEKLSDEV
jgi:hypothetical protein